MATLTEFQASALGRAANDVATAAAVGVYKGALIDLYQTEIGITPTTPLATFQAAVATYGGYAEGTITWDVPSLDTNGNVVVVGNTTLFKPTGSATPNQIYGVYITDLVGGALLFAGPLDGAPLPMLSALNQIQVIVRYYPQSQSLTITVV